MRKHRCVVFYDMSEWSLLLTENGDIQSTEQRHSRKQSDLCDNCRALYIAPIKTSVHYAIIKRVFKMQEKTMFLREATNLGIVA